MEIQTEKIISYLFNQEIRFEYFESLYLLLIIPVLLIIQIFYISWKKKKLSNLFTKNLHSKLILFNSNTRKKIKLSLKILSILLIVLSLSQPQLYTYKKKEISEDDQQKNHQHGNGIEIMLALDISHSMLCKDVNPKNRLYKSKETLKKLIKKLNEHKIGLVVFAGKAFTLVPLTNDHNYLINTINKVDTKMMNLQGTNISECINKSIKSFNFNNEMNKCIVIISDGENQNDSDISEILNTAREKKIFIQTISIGSIEGGLIPLINKNDYKTDNGKYVTTKPDIKFLESISESANGMHIYLEKEDIQKTINQINLIEGSNYEKPINKIKEIKLELKKEKELYIYILYIAFIIILCDLFLITAISSNKFNKI